MGRLTLILGGARGGKSAFAEELAGRRSQEIVYLATAEALDEEMAARVAAHQKSRPGSWRTLEIPREVGKRVLAQETLGDLVLLDCLTMLVSNVLLDAVDELDSPDETKAAMAVEKEVAMLIDAVQKTTANWIVVSNEVGMGVVPPYPLGRFYRDLLGRVNRQVAAEANEIFLVIAGLPIALHKLVAKPNQV